MRIKNLIEGLNAQQRSVPQLPAQARAKNISVLGAKTDPKHPFAGYMVGADESAEPGKKSIGPDQNDPYEKGWRAGFRHNESNPYPAGSKEAQQWDDGYAEAEAQPRHYDESLESNMPDLEEVGEPVESIMDAERRMAAGDRIFAAHEMDEEPFEIFNVGDLRGYTYDQLLAVPQGVAEGKPQKRADRYHINKDGKPASLASYADKSSAVKDRDAKYPDAKVHQVGPRGKVKGEFEEGMAEGKWNYPPEYTKKANADDEAELGVSLNNKDARKAWRKKQKAKAHKELMTGKKKEPGVSEGAKVDRMVRHIASSEKATGKSNKDAENIAWATVNKRGYLDNKNKKKHVAEAGTPADIRAKNRAVVKKIQGKEVKEDITQEDIITKLKAKLGDYLSDLGQQIKKDPALQDKLSAKPAGNQMGPPVKTVTTDDGHQIQIHGNEADGFRISIKNRQTPSQFKNLDEAVMACEMYCARRRTQALNADYVEEA